MIIKVILIASVLAVVLWLVRARPGGRRLAIVRLGGLAFAALWVAAVLAPEAVTWVANLVGVGRGTDLVLYVLVVAFTFATVGQHHRLRGLEDRLAELTRANALLQHEVDQLSAESPETRG